MKTLARLSAVLKWLIASAGRSFSTAVAEQLRLLPLLFKVKHSLAHSFIHSIHQPPAPLFFPPFFAPESRDLGALLSQLTSLPPSAADRPRGERRQLRRAEEGRQDLPVPDVSGAPLHRADPHGAQRPAGGELEGEPVPVGVCLNGNTVLITHEVRQNTTGRFTLGVCLTRDA